LKLKILPIGEGDYEKDMIDLLLKKVYKGGFGILGHDKDAEVETILKANLIGLKNQQLEKYLKCLFLTDKLI